MAINKDINKNLMDLLSSTEKASTTTNIDTLQSKEYLQRRELQRDIQGQQKALTNTNTKEANSSSVFSVRIKNKDVVALKQALEKQGINNFSTGLRTIIYKYMQDNSII